MKSQYTVQFTAVRMRAPHAPFSRTYKVVAPDTYTALDLLDAKHNLRAKFRNACFKFGEACNVGISQSTLHRALRATRDEEQSTDAPVRASAVSKKGN